MMNCKTCPALAGFLKYRIEVRELVTLWRYFDHRGSMQKEVIEAENHPNLYQ